MVSAAEIVPQFFTMVLMAVKVDYQDFVDHNVDM